MSATFQDFPLALINPSFDSDLVDVLNELEILRHIRLQGDVHPQLFLQLKSIFYMLESLGSARIEGNHTTLSDYVEQKLSDTVSIPEQLAEIRNIEHAMQYVDEVMSSNEPISEYFIRELHALTVKDLVQEGDLTPGQYRQHQVKIAQSRHLPPDALLVPDYMQDLVAFINRKDKPKYDLLKVALAHHRFGWIHPFGNGNGRTVRLLTYALLIKYGFNVQAGGRILNPTAVFCNDRNKYYEMLAIADTGTPEALEQWCTYVLLGISTELKKIDSLTQLNFLYEHILKPAIHFSFQRGNITEQEVMILEFAAKSGEFKAGDLAQLFPSMTANQRTYQIKKLLEQHFISPIEANSRIYVANFAQSYLLRGIIHALNRQGFIGKGLQ